MEITNKQQTVTTSYKKVVVKIKKLVDNAVIPFYSHEGDMGMDLVATSMEYDVKHDYIVYHTGIAVELPKGYGMALFPRSSNRDTDAYMTNHVGIIDSGYRGEVLACFKNRTSSYSIQLFNKAVFAINSILSRLGLKNLQVPFNAKGLEFPYHPGDKIGQVVILPYPTVEFKEVDELSPSERGENGHGSTGKTVNK